MNDDKPKPPAEEQPAPGEEQAPETAADPGEERAPETPAADADGTKEEEAAPAEAATEAADAEAGEAPAKPKLSDKEKAAKIEAAKAKAAAAKAAKEEQDAEPKPPWMERPVTPEHEDAADDDDATALADAVAGAVLGADRFAGDVTLTVPRDRIIEICSFLKNERSFSFLVDLTAVDRPEREEGRFDVIYWMHRFSDSKRIRLCTVLPEDEPIASATAVWKTANWMEREVYDLFGIIFEGHPGLERILTWEGFNGHPLRKDFPVEGIDTGAAIYPDVYPPGGGPVQEEEPQPEQAKGSESE
jgi:NADH-quinone oxidoreductase subunit C